MLKVGFISLFLIISLATPSVEEPNESWIEAGLFEGDSCVEIAAPFLKAGSGARFVPFTGKVITIDATGELAPVSKAKVRGPLYVTTGGTLQRRKHDLRVSKDGTFNGVIGLLWDEHIVCRESRIAFERWIDDAEVFVTAKGCADKTIQYGQESAGIEIRLECHQ